MPDEYIRLNWRRRGYFEFPVINRTRSPDQMAEVSAWSEFAQVLASAKRGDFSPVPSLINIYDNTDNWLIARACCDLMADAGSRSLFEKIAPAVRSVVEPTYAVQWGQALCNWGNLRVVPLLLESLRSLEGFDDAEDLAEDIAKLLELEEPGTLLAAPGRNFDGFIEACDRTYKGLVSKFRNDNLVVFKGEEFSVARVAQVTLSRLDQLNFDEGLRRKFEANTGIDCTAFFNEDGALVPLAAAAILETFLENEEIVHKFAPGQRYFFGHPVPD